MKKIISTKFDNKILLTFLCLTIIGILFMVYQYFNHVDCDNSKYFITSKYFSVGSTIEYEDQTFGANKWEWNFGDDSPVDNRQHTFHQYKKAGTYKVKLTINGNCSKEKVIKIDNSQIIDQSKIPVILALEAVMQGKPIQFNCEYSGAETWEWSFGETPGLDALTKSPIFTYNSIGVKKVTLLINGDYTHIATKTIYVGPKKITKVHKLNLESYNPELPVEAFSLPPGNPKKDPLLDMLQYLPVTPKSGKVNDSINNSKKAPLISEEQFKLLLLNVANESKTKEDFKKYVCDNYDIPVIKNGKEIITFTELCKAIAGKKIKITALRLNKNEQNCIGGISLNYKIKKTVGWGTD